MTGWNLPPGCRVSDIPGNRPEDIRREQRAEHIYDVIKEAYDTLVMIGKESVAEALDEQVETLMDEAYAEGYAEAVSDDAQSKLEDSCP